MSNPGMIELKNVCKGYTLSRGRRLEIMHNLYAVFPRNAWNILLGASGSGKTTLLNLIGALESPDSGSIEFDGTPYDKLFSSAAAAAEFRNRKIGFVFQSFNLLPRTSALENVIMPLAYTAGDLSRKECRARGLAALERVGLSDRVGHFPSQLSGGQQQRVAIARALINHPPVLFADEPTGNLDSHTSIDVMRMFDELNAQGITVILVTHSMEIAEFARRVVRISDGEIREDYLNPGRK